MNVSSIRAAIAKARARPVFIRLTDGRALPVAHSDFAMFSPDASEFILYLPTGGFEVVAIGEIASIQVGEPAKPKA